MGKKYHLSNHDMISEERRFVSLFLLRRKRKLAAILLSIVLIMPVTVLAESSPTWLSEGAYAKYACPSPQFFQWSCARIDGDRAEIEVSLSINQTTERSALIYIDIQKRGTTMPNGTYLGRTALWLPANPYQDEEIELFDNESDTADVEGWMLTVQGAQKIFGLNREGGFWDLDTGVLLSTYYLDDAAFKAIGLSALGRLSLVETNIDLGPREWWAEIILAMPYILPIIALVAVLAFVIRRRQQRKNQRKPLAKKQRKFPKNSADWHPHLR